MNYEWRLYKDFKHTRDYSRVPDYRSFAYASALGVGNLGVRNSGVAFDLFRPVLTFTGDFTGANYAYNATTMKGYFVESANLNNDGTTTLSMAYDVWANSRSHYVNHIRINRTTAPVYAGIPQSVPAHDDGTYIQTGAPLARVTNNTFFAGSSANPVYFSADDATARYAIIVRFSYEKEHNDTPAVFMSGAYTLKQAFETLLRLYRTKNLVIAAPSGPMQALNGEYQINQFFECFVINWNFVRNFPTIAGVTINSGAVQYFADADDLTGADYGVTTSTQSEVISTSTRFGVCNSFLIGNAKLPMKQIEHNRANDYDTQTVVSAGYDVELSLARGLFVRLSDLRGSEYDVTEQFAAQIVLDSDADYRENKMFRAIIQSVSGAGAAIGSAIGIISALATGGAALPAIAGVSAASVSGIVGVTNAAQGVSGIMASRPAEYRGAANFLDTARTGLCLAYEYTSNGAADYADFKKRGLAFQAFAVPDFVPRVTNPASGNSDYYEMASVKVSGAPAQINSELENIYKRGVEIFYL